MKRLLNALTRLPRHPFKLARALVGTPGPDDPRRGNRPRRVEDLPAWTERFPIVIAYNNIPVATGIHALLTREGWRSILCETAHDVVRLCQETPVSMVIVGPYYPYYQPDESRDELTQDLANHPATRAIPILALTQVVPPGPPPPRMVYLPVPFNPAHLIGATSHMALIMGHWNLPPGYDPERAKRVLADHVYAR